MVTTSSEKDSSVLKFSLYKKAPAGVGVSDPQIILNLVEWVASGLTPLQVAELIDERHPEGGVEKDLYVLSEEPTLN